MHEITYLIDKIPDKNHFVKNIYSLVHTFLLLFYMKGEM